MTKADKHILKEQKASSDPKTHRLDPKQDPESLFRMTLDFRNINRLTLNEKSVQMPSLQSIEASFSNCLISTFDVSNMYPSICLTEDSQNYLILYIEVQVFNHARLPQGWSASLGYA